jgi:single-stranded-DNA-specific exonuclease
MSLESKLLFQERVRAPRVSARVVLRKENTRERAKEISRTYKLAFLPSLVVAARNIESEIELNLYLSPTLKEGLPDPSLMKNLSLAAERVLLAIKQKEKIAVFSDFDVDGISAAAQLVPFLAKLGADVFHYAPNRFTEGYGLSKAAAEKLAAAGANVLVTVDCGATSHEAIQFAKQKGLYTIVIDHHQLHGVSPADILVDPAQEDCQFQKHQLCAAGIIWFFLVELRRHCQKLIQSGKLPANFEIPDPKNYLDLAALGTVCDMVPLIGPNRVLASKGIELMERTKRLGLTALKGVSKLSGRMSTGGISFGLGPRINAAGRLADASFAFELLTTENELRAQELAQMIDKLNTERRDIEERVKFRCLDILGNDHSNLHALAVFDPDFHAGVIGIVAQRLVELFNKPSAVMAPGEMLVGRKSVSVIKGSVRSVRGFHVADALKTLSPLLINHGGHGEAGGFSIEESNLNEFKQAFSDLALKTIPTEFKKRQLLADAEVSFDVIDFTGIEQLEKLQPFGIGNPGPVFISKDVLVEHVSVVGEKHLKVKFRDGNFILTGLCWNFEGNEFIRKGERLNIAFTPELNSFQGITSVQLNVKEVWINE